MSAVLDKSVEQRATLPIGLAKGNFGVWTMPNTTVSGEDFDTMLLFNDYLSRIDARMKKAQQTTALPFFLVRQANPDGTFWVFKPADSQSGAFFQGGQLGALLEKMARPLAERYGIAYTPASLRAG